MEKQKHGSFISKQSDAGAFRQLPWYNKPLRTIAAWDASIHAHSWIVYGCLLLYGVVFALWLVPKFNTVPADVITPAGDYAYVDEYMSIRQIWLNDFIASTRSTGIYTQLSTFYDHNSSYYLYLSTLGAKYNLAAWQLFLYTQMIAGGLLIAVYPCLTYKATHSVTCGLIAPVWIKLFITDILLKQLSDTYWALYWIVLFSVPILYALISQAWNRKQYIWLAALLLAMGVANLPRAHAGIGILVACILIACIKLRPCKKHGTERTMREWLRLPVAILSILLSYCLFTAVIPSAYQLATDQPPCIGSLGPGHALYCGIGWEENPFGIRFLDADAFEAAGDVGLSEYASQNNPLYSKKILELYLDLVKENPSFFIGSYLRKVAACIKLALAESKTVRNLVLWKAPRFYILLLLGAAMAFLPADRTQRQKLLKNMLRFLGIWLILFSASLLPGMIARPRWTYLNGAIGAIDALIYMSAMILLSQSIRNLLDRVSDSLATRRQAPPSHTSTIGV